MVKTINLSTVEIPDSSLYYPARHIEAYCVEKETVLVDKVDSGTVNPERAVPEKYWVIKNAGEQYVMSPTTFTQHYQPTSEPNIYQSTHTVRAIKNPYSTPIVAKTVWGEQAGSENCWIVEESTNKQRHLMEHNVFTATYSTKKDRGIN